MERRPVVQDRWMQRAEWLRGRFAEHNRLVILLVALTLLVTAGVWYLLFAALYWLTFLFASVVRGMDARPPDALPAFFIYSAGLLLLLTWFARKRLDNEMPKDEKTPAEIAMEFLLAMPRATLALWGNVSAWQKLDKRELGLAAELIERIVDEERVPLHEVPVEIPDPRDRTRILTALQLIDVLNVRQGEDAVWLTLKVKGG